MTSTDKTDFQRLGQQVIKTELAEITALLARIDESFVQACELLLSCKGRIVEHCWYSIGVGSHV